MNVLILHLLQMNVQLTILLGFQAAPVNIIVGSHVWLEDPEEAWIDGEVTKINGHELHVRAKNGKMVNLFTLKPLVL